MEERVPQNSPAGVPAPADGKRRGAAATVTLAPLAAGHADATYRWLLDPVVRDNLGLRSEPTPAKTQSWIAAAESDPLVHAFAVLSDGLHVGNVVLDRVDLYLMQCRLSVYVGEPAARGRGVGGAAVGTALRHAFGPLGLGKVWLTAHPENAAALALYARAGFRLEGTLREEFILNGRRLAALYLGLLAREFSPEAST